MLKRPFSTLLALAIAALVANAPVSGQKPPAPKQIPAPADVAAPPADAAKTASGLTTKVVEAGKGTRRPTAPDYVKVHYSGWTADGKMFDSSHARNEPSIFGVSRVIPGYSEGLQLMVEGEKRRLWIPKNLAYEKNPERPQGTLVFDVELIEVIPNPATNPPADVAAAPADAKRTASGIAYKVLRPGTGTTRPQRRSQVTVHYTGWTTDGKMFDSSIVSGRTATFGLDEVIEGWTEGVQLMVEGEKMRFWIPERLAYKGERPPRGTLVFDIELLSHRAP